MAELYLARAPTPLGGHGKGEVVVLKRMLPHLAEDLEFVRMFRDEAHLACALEHPNIVRALSIGPPDEHFFTMEYVHGEHLRAIFEAAAQRGEAIPLAHILTIALGLTAALHHTHEQTDEHGRPLHIVHRDVSPTNVLIAYEGRIKLVDFGVAKAAAGTHVTQAGTLKGKLAYMSPEQCRAGDIDRRSDVFAVGVLLYEMTTLTRLFQGASDVAVLHEVMAGVRTPPSALRRGYPPQLERIVLEALQTDPDDRYPSAAALHEDLAAFGRRMGVRASEEALSRYLIDLFGARPLPWQQSEQAPSLHEADRTMAAGDPVSAPARTVVGPPRALATLLASTPEKTAVASLPGPLPIPPSATFVPQERSPAPAPASASPLLLGGITVAVLLGVGVTLAIAMQEPDDAAEVIARAPSPAPEAEPPPPHQPPAPLPQPIAEPDDEVEVPPEFTKPPEFLPAKARFVLQKIEGEGRDRTATIALADGTSVSVALGASVEEFRVVAINEASVLLERDDGPSKLTRRLEL